MTSATPTLTRAQQAAPRPDRRRRPHAARRARLRKIQVKDVATSAQVALGTLYHYFSSKEHLFAEVLVRWAATLRTTSPAIRCGEIPTRSDSPK